MKSTILPPDRICSSERNVQSFEKRRIRTKIINWNRGSGSGYGSWRVDNIDWLIDFIVLSIVLEEVYEILIGHTWGGKKNNNKKMKNKRKKKRRRRRRRIRMTRRRRTTTTTTTRKEKKKNKRRGRRSSRTRRRRGGRWRWKWGRRKSRKI